MLMLKTLNQALLVSNHHLAIILQQPTLPRKNFSHYSQNRICPGCCRDWLASRDTGLDCCFRQDLCQERPRACMSLLDQHLRSLARSNPERLITVCQGRERTSAELDGRIGRLSWALRQRLALRPGDRVALASLGTDFFLEAFLACIRAGLVAVLVNWRWSTAEAAQALSLCKPKALITDSACSSFLKLTSIVTGITSTLLIGPKADAAPLASSAEDLLAAAGNVSLTADSDVQQPAVICFTSGSTGENCGKDCNDLTQKTLCLSWRLRGCF